MNAKVSTVEPEAQRWYSQDDKTSATDDERILDITPLPPPEHLIRFFPIRNTPMDAAPAEGLCPFTGAPAVERILVARAY